MASSFSRSQSTDDPILAHCCTACIVVSCNLYDSQLWCVLHTVGWCVLYNIVEKCTTQPNVYFSLCKLSKHFSNTFDSNKKRGRENRVTVHLDFDIKAINLCFYKKKMALTFFFFFATICKKEKEKRIKEK